MSTETIRRRVRRSRRGAVLVVVIWMMVILLIVAMGLAFTTQLSARSVGNEEARTRAYFAATSGIERLADMLSRLFVAPFDAAAAETYGALRARLEAAGIGLSVQDGLIAAHALSLGAVLVSADAAFAQVPGLGHADWTIPASR